MDNLTLIDVNKPEKIKEALNELINYKNTNTQAQEVTAETIGLGNVDNTHDADKPLSIAQKTYIDSENSKDVKLNCENIQRINSDISLGSEKKLFLEKDGTFQECISTDDNNLNLGSLNLPINLRHKCNDSIKNPIITITDTDGSISQEKLAFVNDVDNCVKNDVFADAENANGVVTDFQTNYFTDVYTDDMSLRVKVRSIKNGTVIIDRAIPLKLANTLSRGLMSKEDVAVLNDLIAKVSSLEGKSSRYLYTDSSTPTAEEIDAFAINLGYSAPFEGIAIIVAETYHVWHYYKNNSIGWKDDGSDTVSQATNSVLGTVIGDTEEGKIYVETNGTMSLVGYDNLINNLSNLEATLNSLSSTIGDIDSILDNINGEVI